MATKGSSANITAEQHQAARQAARARKSSTPRKMGLTENTRLLDQLHTAQIFQSKQALAAKRDEHTRKQIEMATCLLTDATHGAGIKESSPAHVVALKVIEIFNGTRDIKAAKRLTETDQSVLHVSPGAMKMGLWAAGHCLWTAGNILWRARQTAAA